MSWYAIDAIDEAFETTRSFLFPFEAGRWLRLAIIVFFLGSVSSGNIQSSSSMDVSHTAPGEDTLALLVGIGLIILALFIVFGLIGSVMRFVLLDSVHTDSIHIRQYFRQRFKKGTRLFLFEIGVLLIAVLPFVVGGVAFISGLLEPTDRMFVLSMVLLILLGVVIALSVTILLDFTISFVAPVMLLEDRGVISGWQRFWPTLKAEWKQYALYVVLNWILNLVAGIIMGIALLLVGLAVLVGIAIPTVVVFGLSETIGLVVLTLLGFVGVLVILVGVFVVQILVKVYFRYYSLLILRETNTEFDLVPATDDGGTASSAVSE